MTTRLLMMIAVLVPAMAFAEPDFSGAWIRDGAKSDVVPNTMYWLTRAVEARETRAAGIIDQGYDSLRADPRFHELVKRLKMPASYDAFLRAKGVAPY